LHVLFDHGRLGGGAADRLAFAAGLGVERGEAFLQLIDALARRKALGGEGGIVVELALDRPVSRRTL
jgi:hypothetical protein